MSALLAMPMDLPPLKQKKERVSHSVHTSPDLWKRFEVAAKSQKHTPHGLLVFWIKQFVEEAEKKHAKKPSQ
jgi:hypothetical protein